MDTQDTAFLNGLLAIEGRLGDYQKFESQKKAMLLRLVNEREKNRATLETGAGLTVERSGGKKKKDRMQLTDLESRDQTTEFDIDDQRDGFRLKDEQDEKSHHDVANLIEKQVAEMQGTVERVNPDTGEKEQLRLFSDEEIAAQVYDPLVRQGLISETMVPSQYSRTQDMLDNSVKAYEERLKRDKRSTAGNFFAENAGLITASLGAMSTFAGGGMDSKVAQDTVQSKGASELATSWDPQKGLGNMKDALKNSASTLEKANQGAKFFAQGLSFVIDVGVPGVQGVQGLVGGDEQPGEGDGESTNKLTAEQAAQLAQVLFGAAAAQLATTFDALTIGLEMSSGFGSCVKRAEVANLLAKGATLKVAESLGTSYTAALKRLVPTDEAAVEAVNESTAAFTSVMKKELANGAIAKALGESDAQTLAPLLTAAGTAAATAASADKLKKLFENDTVAQQAVKSKAAKMMAEEFGDDGPRAEEEKAHKKAGHEHVPDWIFSDKKKKWVCAVCEAETGEDPALFAGMLERRIAQLERDKALLEWSTKLVGLGIDAAANFIAPLAAVGSAVKMAKNILLAGMRTRDLVVFLDKRKGLTNAASAFSPAVSQFIVNSRSQALHYAANAAFEAVKIIGAALQCGGITAPAGFATTTAATMAQALEAVIYEIDKRVKLEAGWTQYRLYLSRQENRRLGLLAVQKNPTLAKYAVAWGALIKKDPLVVDFIGACGLTPETLKDPRAELDTVVKYLEARMPDDNVVTGRAGKFDVGEIQLTQTSWMKVQTSAIKDAQLAPGGTGMIVACLRKWAKESPELQRQSGVAIDPNGTEEDKKKAAAARLVAQKKADEILAELSKALNNYAPKTAKGKSCQGMLDARALFIDHAITQREAVRDWIPA